ncbi:Heme chaperone CcmE [Serratia rubidaea]|uniref:Heme chaperone CcmE n=1 Tax=Serratia rubidaea TaxID=61652 RepID=A0A4U9HMI5_SERRU|nr:Heme chaperone CcmE [Serratia rubidaea]
MNPRRKSRLYLALVVLVGIALTASLVLYALRSNIDLFYTRAKSCRAKGKIMRSRRSGSACASAAW